MGITLMEAKQSKFLMWNRSLAGGDGHFVISLLLDV